MSERRTLKLTPEPFSRGYVENLRKEAKQYREQAAEAAARVKALEEIVAQGHALEEARAQAQREADARAIDAAIEAAARAACMFDPGDLLKLADTSTVTVDADGEVHGAAELIAALRQAKPFLFGAAYTSTPKEPPRLEAAAAAARNRPGAR